MTRLTKQQKVEKYLSENRVFPLSKSFGYEVWGVEGQIVYTVMYNKLTGAYTCS
jgi:hypothetical protein